MLDVLLPHRAKGNLGGQSQRHSGKGRCEALRGCSSGFTL